MWPPEHRKTEPDATYHDDHILAAISDDSGATWMALASEPPHPNNHYKFTPGPVAISADGKIIAWTPLGGAPFFTSDRGKTWQPTHLPANVHVIGDRVDPAAFYGYDAADGSLYVSTDRGATFTRVEADLAKPLHQRYGPEYGDLAAVPECAGELWLAAGGQLYRFTEHGMKLAQFKNLSEVSAVGFGKNASGADHPAIFVTATLDGVHGIYRSDDIGAGGNHDTIRKSPQRLDHERNENSGKS